MKPRKRPLKRCRIGSGNHACRLGPKTFRKLGSYVRSPLTVRRAGSLKREYVERRRDIYWSLKEGYTHLMDTIYPGCEYPLYR